MNFLKIFGENASKTDDFRLFFGAERYDYTKGIQFKLKAFGKYLENHPERKGKDVLFQLAVINRRGVQSYRNYQASFYS
jgi:trehalose 6-phosphate synthase/phosphatase